MSTPDLPPPATPTPAAPPAKKSNTLVIVLCVVFGVLILVIGSCVGTCIYVGKKAKEYANESEKNPQVAALAIAAAIYPGVEVVSKDLDAGTLVLKNSKTGEIVKLDAKDFTQEKIAVLLDKIAHGKSVEDVLKRDAGAAPSSSPADASEKNEAVFSGSQGDALKTFRPDFPVYTSGEVTTVEATQNAFSGLSTSLHVFVTSDSPSKVVEFYSKKLTSDGYTVAGSDNGSDDNGARLSRIFQKGGMGSTFNLEVHVEDGKTHVQANQVLLKQ